MDVLHKLQRTNTIEKIREALDSVTGSTNHSEMIGIAIAFEEKYSLYPYAASDAIHADCVKVLAINIAARPTKLKLVVCFYGC